VPGGFIGVDVFFVVSGFIVTRLLLVERARTGRIGLRAFWARRARRILPALAAVLAVCVPLAFAVDPNLLAGIRRQLVGAVTFSSNWLAIAVEGDYFHAEQPELFTNLWSLAVEEQFYLLCPVLLIVALRFRRRAVLIGVLVLAGVSALAMALWSGVPFGSPTRAYFGTDTHAFGLLIGVALAVALGASELRVASGRRMVARATVSCLSLLVLVVLSAGMASSGWFPRTAVSSSRASPPRVSSGLSPSAPVLGRILDVEPLRWLGERSYAVYLWHWPLLLILGATPLRSVPILLAVSTAGLSIAAAAASFVFVEAPFRRRGSSDPRSRVARRPVVRPVIVSSVIATLALGSVAVVVAHDDVSDAEQLVARGRSALGDSSPKDGEAKATPSSIPDAKPTPESTASPAAPTPEPILGTDITAVGDSVMLAAAPELQSVLPGIDIDAEVSRSMWVAPDILSADAASGGLRSIVVLGLATNGEVGTDQLDRVLGVVGTDRTLVLVNARADRGWIPGANSALTAFAEAHPNVAVADWDAAIAPHPERLAGDGIHPEPAGSTVYVQAIAQAIVAARTKEADAAAQARAEASRGPEGGQEDDPERPGAAEGDESGDGEEKPPSP
jgi:peptidoglycan/LPS O-acetylase OafA/YrhL